MGRFKPVQKEPENVMSNTMSSFPSYKDALRDRESHRLGLPEGPQVGSAVEIIGDSPSLKRVLQQIETVAATDSTVLVQGETGTGKELVAKRIHQLSARRNCDFVVTNCASIPAGLLESELFGHERGAFTGAIAQNLGRFEQADHGTLFLDEIGDFPIELQPKLLRALQEQEFERLGGRRTIHVDFRLVAATNRDLGQMVEQSRFRNDLYYRINVFPIEIPALRHRASDIPKLASSFVRKYAKRMDKHIEKIRAEDMAALTDYPWPGNIRELQNFIERSVILTNEPVLYMPIDDLHRARSTPKPAMRTLAEAEREYILQTLRETEWVVGGPHGASTMLGVKRTTLLDKMRRLGISRPTC
jgi:formate hydrogenlyase transcriptional activator